MRERALIHVGGPPGSGKTTFIERLLEAGLAHAHCVRAQIEPELELEIESALPHDAELQRYRDAGAYGAVRYRFSEPDTPAFFEAAFMRAYSDAVFIEGQSPINHVDLSVFVARPPSQGRSLLRRVARKRRVSRPRPDMDSDDNEALLTLLGNVFGKQMAKQLRKQSGLREHLLAKIKGKPGEAQTAPDPSRKEHWALEEGYEGLEGSQLIVVNVGSQADRLASADFLEQVALLREDTEIFQDIVAGRGHRIAITALAADLTDPKDAGLKKALARVRRTLKRGRQ